MDAGVNRNLQDEASEASAVPSTSEALVVTSGTTREQRSNNGTPRVPSIKIDRIPRMKADTCKPVPISEAHLAVITSKVRSSSMSDVPKVSTDPITCQKVTSYSSSFIDKLPKRSSIGDFYPCDDSTRERLVQHQGDLNAQPPHALMGPSLKFIFGQCSVKNREGIPLFYAEDGVQSKTNRKRKIPDIDVDPRTVYQFKTFVEQSMPNDVVMFSPHLMDNENENDNGMDELCVLKFLPIRLVCACPTVGNPRRAVPSVEPVLSLP